MSSNTFAWSIACDVPAAARRALEAIGPACAPALRHQRGGARRRAVRTEQTDLQRIGVVHLDTPSHRSLLADSCYIVHGLETHEKVRGEDKASALPQQPDSCDSKRAMNGPKSASVQRNEWQQSADRSFCSRQRKWRLRHVSGDVRWRKCHAPHCLLRG